MIIIIVILIIVWLAYEIIRAPLMPYDYGLTDEEIKEWKELTKENKNEENE